MLTRIRKATDHLFIRIILTLIAFSFVAAGAASFMGGNSSEDLVIFDKADSISMNDFLSTRYQHIDNIQRQSGKNLSKEDIESLKINHISLTKLINERILNYLAKYYDFNISKNTIFDFIKKHSAFKNSNGDFDISIYKSIFGNSPKKEKEYLDSLSADLINSSLQSVFLGAFNPPRVMVDNIVNYIAELRTADIVSVNIDRKPANYKSQKPGSEQIESFYKANQALFTVPELRSFEYIKSDKNFLLKKIKISEDELKKFFEENKDDFPQGNYSAVKKQVKDALLKEKLEGLNNEFAQKLEDDVSTGLTIKEIANKYSLKLYKVENISFANMKSSKISEYKDIIDSVFEMSDGEMSYPIEISSQNQIFLISLNKIHYSRQESLNEVENKIIDLLQKREVAFANIQHLENIRKDYNIKKLDNKDKSINILRSQSFTREELLDSNKFPAELLNAIFLGKNASSTPITVANGKAYFAYIKSIKLSGEKIKELKNNSEPYLKDSIKYALFEELITHLGKKNNMRILKRDLNSISD